MKNKGISLIVLIITIVVIIVLATAIIINIAKTNIIENANESILKQDFKTLQEELNLYIANKYIVSNTSKNEENFNPQTMYADEITVPSVYEILPSLKNSKYDGYVYILNGKIALSNKMLDNQRELINEIISTETYVDSTLESDKRYTLQSGESMLLPNGARYEIILNNENISLSGRKVSALESSNSSDSMTLKGTINGNTYNIQIYVIPKIENNEYIIKTGEDLLRAAFLINNKILETQDIKLESNVDLSNVCSESLGKSWVPIGSSGSPYKGTFNGQNYTINNLYINTSQDFQALIGYNVGNIEDVNIGNSYINAKSKSGLICGYNDGGKVSNCNVYDSNEIHGSSPGIGGVVGANYNKGTISQCYNKASVNSTYWEVGGIVGYNYGTVDRCMNEADISSNYVTIGGIVGGNYAVVTNCCNLGDIISTGSDTFGGIAGYVALSSGQSPYDKVTMKNNINLGTINSSRYLRGGIIGNLNTTEYDFQNNYYLDSCGASYGIGNGSEIGTKGLSLSNFNSADLVKTLNSDGEYWELSSKGYPVLKF